MLIAMATALSGCMSDMPDLGLDLGMGGSDASDVTRAAPSASTFAQTQGERGEEHRSSTIDTLIARRSILPAGSSYKQVADAVLAASSRTAEAELMRARMRAKAADKNWLPRLGPNLSLTSMSSFVASLVIDAVLFDNGKKAAERDFARADVEAAAVTLSIAQNDRVHEGLTLFLEAEEARAKAAASSAALTEMRELDRIMSARVSGGISDLSEQNVIRAKHNELVAANESELNSAATAIAELKVMAAGPVETLHGASSLTLPTDSVQALTMLLAAAERDRDLAHSEIERAGLIPGLAGAAEIGASGNMGAGVRLTSDQGLGFDLFDNMKAADAGADAASRRVAQAQEDANRRIASLREKRRSQLARAEQANTLARQSRANAELFQKQFKAGTRSVLEVAGVVETMARLDQDVVAARFEIARTEIEIARELGLLADGDKV